MSFHSRVLIWLFALAAASQLSGQNRNTAGSPGDTAGAEAIPRQTMLDSASLFAAGDIVRGEASLFALNQSVEGSAEWFEESSRRLLELAFVFEARHDYPSAQQLARLAIDPLAQAELKSRGGNSRLRVQVFLRQGYIYDHFLSDAGTALSYYQQALQLAPASPKASKEVDRLSKALASRSGKK